MLESISREEVTDRAWLAGIIDGEGCLQLVKNESRYYAKVVVENTDPRMIQRISQIWSRHGIKFAFQFNRRNGKRDTLVILTTGMGSTAKALELVLPYLSAKRDQADCLLSFIVWREDQGYHTRSIPGFTEIAEAAQAELAQLKRCNFNLQRLQRTASQPLQVG